MRRSRALAISVLFLLGSLPACSVRHGDFTVLSSRLVRLSEFELSKANRVKNVEGRDVSHIIVFVSLKQNPSLEDAINDALEKADGDVMTDVVVNYWFWYIPYIYGQQGWSVRGDVVKTRGD